MISGSFCVSRHGLRAHCALTGSTMLHGGMFIFLPDPREKLIIFGSISGSFCVSRDDLRLRHAYTGCTMFHRGMFTLFLGPCEKLIIFRSISGAFAFPVMICVCDLQTLWTIVHRGVLKP